MIITNVELLAISSNHKAMFPEYSKNISRISVSKIFQRYPQNIARLWKHFYEVKKFNCQKVKILILAVPLLQCFSGSYWNRFSFRVKFWKVSHWCLTAVKNLKLAQRCYIIIINLFNHVFNVSVCSAQRQVFVIACFDIMQFREFFKFPPIGNLTAQSQQ